MLGNHDMDYRVSATMILQHVELKAVRDLGRDAGAWAIAMAERVPPDNGPHRSMLSMLVFLALARAKVPIEQRWERLFPNLFGVPDAILVECADALPESRREAVLIDEIKRSLSDEAVIAILDKHPSGEVVRALLAKQEPGSKRWKRLGSALRKQAKKSPVIAQALDAALGSAPKSIKLVVASSRRPKTARDLTKVEREQLRIAGKGYDGLDLPADQRLAEPKDPRQESPSFAGSLEIRHIADAKGTVLYDMLLYMADAGSIFRAGTTESIGGINQGGVDLLEKQPALRTALQLAADTHTQRRTSRASKTR
jgi:hypothetical protein